MVIRRDYYNFTEYWQILTQNNVGVGQITRSAKDCLDPGLCFMTFPQDLEVGMKAVLLGALVWMVRSKTRREWVVE